MTIKNYDQVGTLIDIGLEEGYLTHDEINDFFLLSFTFFFFYSMHCYHW